MNQRNLYQALPPGLPLGPPQQEPTVRERVDRLKSLSRRAIAYWKAAGLIFVVVCALGLAAALQVKFLYKSEVTFLFKPAIRTTDRPTDEGDTRAQRIGAKLKDVLTTRTRLEGMIKQFNLYPKTVDSRGMVEAVAEMADHIGFRARDGETYTISFDNEAPETAQNVTRALGDSLIKEFTQTSASAAQEEASFLGAQERRSAQELEAANRALATFLTAHPEFSIEAKTTAFGGAAGMPVQATVPLMPTVAKDPTMGDAQLAALYRQRSRLEAEQKMGTGAAPQVGGGDSIPKLTAARDDAAKNAAAAAADLAEKRTRLTDVHPDVISAKVTSEATARALRQAELQLAAATAAQGGSNPYEAAPTDSSVQRQIAAVNAQISARTAALRHSAPGASAPGATSEGDASAAPMATGGSELVQLETEWQRLLSNVHDVRVEHDDLKQKLERAKLQSSAAEEQGGDTMMVIDPAYLPLHPSKGGRTKTASMGGFVALILALSYAFARVLFNDTIVDAADVEAMRLIPLLGVVPRVRAGMPQGGAQAAQKEMDRV